MKWIAGTLLVLSTTLYSATAVSSPPFSVSVETGWPAPPLVLEILESAYDENPRTYFPLLKLLAKHIPLLGSTPTPSSVLSTAIDLIRSHGLLPVPSELSTFNLALALHTSAPRIEAAYAAYKYSIDEDAFGVRGCEAWVEWRGKGFCGVEELQRDIERSIEEGTHIMKSLSQSLPLDHVSSSLPTEQQAVFYYSPSALAVDLLEYLDHHSDAYPSFQYIVRYRPPIDTEGNYTISDRRTPVSGYGVEMALKKTDYLVVDDRATGGSSGQAPLAAPISSNMSGPFVDVFGTDPWSDVTSAPLTSFELRDLGLQAVALIKASDDPLEALIHLSQDFPKYSAALARRIDVPLRIRNRAQRLASRHPIGPIFMINGKAIKETDVNAFGLLREIRDERHHMISLISLGLTPQQAFSLISDPEIGDAQTDNDPLEGLVDASDRLEGGDVIGWLNDIEKDVQYSQWPIHLQGYLRPLYPGQLHTIRRNTWNLVLAIDLASSQGLDIIVNSLNVMLMRKVPLHIGIVPIFSNYQETSAQLASIFYHIYDTLGSTVTKQFFAELAVMFPGTVANPTTVDIAGVRAAYGRLPGATTPFDEIIDSPESEARLRITEGYLARLLATKEESPAGHFFVNGKHGIITQNKHWTQSLQSELTAQLGHLQEALHAGYLPDGDSISTYFYDLPTTLLRRNKLIMPSGGDNRLRTFNLLDVFSEDASQLMLDFVYPNNENAGVPLTIWVIGDLDSHDGRRVIVDALSHLQNEECASRLGFVHVPCEDASYSSGYRLSTLIYQLLSSSALSKTTPAELKSLIAELETAGDNLVDTGDIMIDNTESALYSSSPLSSFTSSGWSVADIALSSEFWKAGAKVAKSLDLKSSLPHLLANGRLVGPLTEKTFGASDFDGLEVYELRKRIHPVIDILRTFYDDLKALGRTTVADLITMSTSIVASAYNAKGAEGIFAPMPGARGRQYEQLDDGELSFVIGDSETALLHVAVVVDPISEYSQRWSSLIKLLSEIEHVAIRVYLDPNTSPQELKLKRFYRSSATSALQFDVDGYEVASAVTFYDLPSTPIFTLAMDTPPSWVLSPKESPLDLDNLLVGNIQEPVHVLFDLKQLVIDGHAREGGNAPPRGLQLQLNVNDEHVVDDTQVMANLGYLQFKATPGVYRLAIRPGRGEEVYEMASSGNSGWDSPEVNISGTEIALASFDGVTVYPRFRRWPGMENADVLSEAVKDDSLVGSMFSKVKSMVGMTKPAEIKPTSRHADINIFTVASGLLYERFASIMILSVMKHTKSSVKFWFIENFLSPTFLAFIPHLAEAYGFEYELVTYKWPSWLRAQTEKQRIIWAYKILFLDVLFPMDLDKVIFVDADQIVRVDMKELVDVDLHGRVYGYPPMGDDREEMEGFRFWKTGYWKDQLRGLPYHISALYVVDLKRFRQLATGDRLRGQYHALSADPNSLANLDQDLPNSMQTSIPIWTLDQDWLWCQTWCSDESLARAKTIDLCQNPLTKEPKLVRARQIPEWDVYDREIAMFAATLESDGGALAANVDDLASEPGSAATTKMEQKQADISSESSSETAPNAVPESAPDHDAVPEADVEEPKNDPVPEPVGRIDDEL